MKPWLSILLLSGCAVDPVAETSEALTQPSRLVEYDNGRFVAYEGNACFTSGVGAAFEQSGAWTLPTWADRGTVIYNGFSDSYTSGDHHMGRVEGRIGKVSVGSDHVLRWTFEGTLQDKNADDGSRVCYWFTVLGWKSSSVDAQAQNEYDGYPLYFLGNGNVTDYTKPLGCGFPSPRVAIMPRGTMHEYAGDAHLFQIASRTTQDKDLSDCVSYNSRILLTDNGDPFADYEVDVGVLSGESVRLWGTDTFNFNERSACSACTARGNLGETTEHVHLTDIPFDYALPMLTGWELFYETSDQHVAKIGASIRNLVFDRINHTMDYDFVSVLADQDGQPPFGARRGVMVLGLNRIDLPPSGSL